MADTGFRIAWSLFSDDIKYVLVRKQQAEISNYADTLVVVQTFIDRWQTVTSLAQRQNECNGLHHIWVPVSGTESMPSGVLLRVDF
jgi:hypothetical protein